MADCWLLLETSGRSCQLGLARGDTVVANRRLEEPRRLARDLASAVRSMLDEQKLQPRELAGVMVGIGPGSYTGLRVGIASAKAFAYAAGCPLIAVPTFTAIALRAPVEASELWVIADGLQGMVYWQRFASLASGGCNPPDSREMQLNQGAYTPHSPCSELQLTRAADVLPTASPDAWFTGPGVVAFVELIGSRATVAELDREPSLLSVYRAGLARSPVTRDELFALEPLYLRGSSAEEKARQLEPRTHAGEPIGQDREAEVGPAEPAQ